MARVHRTNYKRGKNYRERAPETWRKHLFSSLLNGDQSLRKRKRPKALKHTTCQLLRKQSQVQTGPGNLNSHGLRGLFPLTSSAAVTMRRNVFSRLGKPKQDLERPNALIKFYVY